MTVLVTGGTGFLGRRLVAQLLKKRQHVAVYGRSRPKGVRFFRGNILDRNALEQAFRKARPRYVYHLAAVIDEADPALYETNVRGTKNVAALCEAYGVKQLIFMSSSAALGPARIATETSSYRPQTPYERSKRDAELIVKHSSIPHTIVRAPVILGPNETARAIFAAARKGYPIIGSGRNHFHVAYVDDVAGLLLHVKGNRKAYGGIFHVATRDAPTYREFYRIICDAIGARMTERHIPVWLAKAHAKAASLLGRKSVVRRASSIDRITRDRLMSMRYTIRRLGFRPKYDTRKAVVEIARSFRTHKISF